MLFLQPVGIYIGKYDWAGNPDIGDCSLRIQNAALEYDDGEWECQVTASDFATQDALTSRPMKLVVRGKRKISFIITFYYDFFFYKDFFFIFFVHQHNNEIKYIFRTVFDIISLMFFSPDFLGVIAQNN